MPVAATSGVRNPYARVRPYSNHQVVARPRGLRVPFTRAEKSDSVVRVTGPVTADWAPMVTNVASAPRVVPSELTPTTLKWYVVFGLRFATDLLTATLLVPEPALEVDVRAP